MERLSVVIGLVISSLLLSCSNPQSPGPGTPDLPKQKKDSFFPLAVGNIWYYNSYHGAIPLDSSKYDDKQEVVLKQKLGNREFYLISDTQYETDGSIRIID